MALGMICRLLGRNGTALKQFIDGAVGRISQEDVGAVGYIPLLPIAH